MKTVNFEHSEGGPKKISFSPPAVELLLDPVQATAVWSEQVADNKDFLQQVGARRILNERLDVVMAKLPRPDMTLAEAIDQGQLTVEQVADLYTSLSDLLADPDYQRLALYLPFEFLPNTSWQPSSTDLQQAAERFRMAYKQAWDALLTTHDVRANFVDGDVLDIESRVGDLPRVVKAAHLVPKLLEAGLIKIEDVFKLMEISKDETLKRSLADTLPVLMDLGFIQTAELARLQASTDAFVQDQVAAMLAAVASVDKKNQPAPETKSIDPRTLAEKFQTDFTQIDAGAYDDNITDKRVAWLKQEKKQQTIAVAGDDIKTAIISQTFSDDLLAKFVSPEAGALSQQALVEGIRKAIESFAQTDREQAQILYSHYRDALLSFWQSAAPELHQALKQTFCRLHGLGLVDDEQLKTLGITIPALAGPFSENLANMKAELGDTQKIVAAIEADPELSRFIYPVVLLFGSRLKGYGEQEADIDLAVMVKPGTAPDQRSNLRAALKRVFAHDKIHGEIMELWLEETATGLGVRDFAKLDTAAGDSSWAHILFGAAWEGNKKTINELREKLLVPYMYDQKKTIHGRDARGLYLEEMERDTLQYRLMHKGYERFFPALGGIKAQHADKIDGRSMFWDSGYRQMATKLFASRVFLPKISPS